MFQYFEDTSGICAMVGYLFSTSSAAVVPARRAETIHSSTNEQRIVMEETAGTVAEISGIAQKTAVLSDSVAVGSKRLTTLSELLTRRMSFFRISGE